MKRKTIILFSLLVILCLFSSCKSSQATEVENMINEIGVISDSSWPAIQAAKDAYAKLSAQDQENVSNYEILVAAENGYNRLFSDVVDQMILEIGEIGDDSYPKIQAARKALDSLTKEQKSLVDHQQMLIDKENEYDTYIVQRAIEMIQSLNVVDPDNSSAFELAEQMYNSLTSDQKKAVESGLGDKPSEAIQKAKVQRVIRLIERIKYKSGTPEKQDLNQILSAASAYYDLESTVRENVMNFGDLKTALSSFASFRNNRAKTDKLYAREIYIEACAPVSYDELMTYSQSYKGKTVGIEIQVDEVSSNWFETTVKAYVPGKDQQIKVIDTRTVKEPECKVGNTFVVYGTAEGTTTIVIHEDGSGWFGTNMFAKETDRFDVPVVKLVYTSIDNLGVIGYGDPTKTEAGLDDEYEKLFSELSVIVDREGI